jgi:DNA-binding CsgD family transcriptional regulator
MPSRDHSAPLRTPAPAALERVHALWDDLADFDAAETDAALEHGMRALCRLLRAQSAFWLGVVRLDRWARHDPLAGWRPKAIRYLPRAPADETYARRSMRALNQSGPNPHELQHLTAHIQPAGAFRASRLGDMMPPDWFDGPAYHEVYKVRGIADVLHVAFPVNDSAESYFGFHRRGARSRFTPEEQDVAAYALRGIKWFHRQLLLSHGLVIARAPLSPAEQRVQRLLLTGLPEKQIAQRLSLSVTTAHTYVTDIFRKFGVNSRAGLMALWLGRRR